MKLSKRRLFGVALLAGSLATWLILGIFGIGRDRVMAQESHSEANSWYSFSITKPGKDMPMWATVALVSCAALGVFLLAVPRREFPSS